MNWRILIRSRTPFVIRSKKVSCPLVEGNTQKYDRGTSKHIYDIVTGDPGLRHMIPKKTVVECMGIPRWKISNKNVRTRSIAKQLVVRRFAKTGHDPSLPLEKGRTVNSELRNQEKQPSKTDLYNNVSSHISAQTIAFLSIQNMDLMIHALYSPGLAADDFLISVLDKQTELSTFSFNWRSSCYFQNQVQK